MNPASNDLAVLVPWVISHGYLIFWFFATIEGPIITIAASVAAALGYFNIFIILLLAFLGDIGGDFFYYGIGYIGHNLIHSRFFKFLGLSDRRIEKVQKLLHNHMTRAVILIKVSPIVGPLGIVVIGATRIKFKKFIKAALYVAIPKSLFFALLGYYSGQTYLELNKIIARGQDIIPWIVAFIIIIYLVYLQVMRKISKGVE